MGKIHDVVKANDSQALLLLIQSGVDVNERIDDQVNYKSWEQGVSMERKQRR